MTAIAERMTRREVAVGTTVTFTATPTLECAVGDIATVRSIGFDAWLNSQFNAPIGISGWEWLNQRGYATVDNSTAYYDNTYPGDCMIWSQLMTSPDSLRRPSSRMASAEKPPATDTLKPAAAP